MLLRLLICLLAATATVVTSLSGSLVQCTMDGSTTASCLYLGQCGPTNCEQAWRDAINNMTAYGGNTLVGIVQIDRATRAN